MNISKCPLCRDIPEVWDLTDLELSYHKKEHVFQVLCDCGLIAGDGINSFFATKDDAITAWNNLISKFPPVMRVHEGDFVEIQRLYGCRKERIYCVESYINATSIGNVTKWPWELNQMEQKS